MKDSVTVTAHVTNRGNYQIQESVQVYIRHEDRADYEPGFQLKGIKNITLNPGETKEAEIVLDMRDFAVITEEGRCVARPGVYKISIGGCQPDQRSVELTGRWPDIFQIKRNGREENVIY